MYKYSQKSKDKLATCHPDIQRVFNEAIKYVDITILEGVRTLETQEEYVRTGKSKTLQSKHLEQADGYSHAVDFAPFPIDWEDRERFCMVAGFIKGIASQMGVNLRLGSDWGGTFQPNKYSFFDGPHIELEID